MTFTAAALAFAALAALPPPALVDRLAGHGVHLEGEGWTAEDAAELLEGIAALPPGLHLEGGPLALVRHREDSPFGMGDGSARWPDWTDGRRRFHLYGVGADGDRRAGARLQALDVEQRARLWRRRAAVHAWLQRLDDARALSASPRWRHAAGWLWPLERLLVLRESPENPYPWAFSRARGETSASLDLVTFGEELLVPAEAVRPGAVPPDDRVRCAERTKSRALLELLASSGAFGGGPAPPPPDCPAFDAFGAPRTVSHLEVWLAAATGREPESLFGHVMLLVARREGEVALSPSFQPVVQPVALTGSERGGLRYLWNGLTGGFSTAFLTTLSGEVATRTRVLEDRGIRRYRLNLSPAELERALERIWDLERRGYPPYRFFNDNCATAILFLLQGALDESRLPVRPGPYAFPSSVLDALADVRAFSGAPLLEHVPDELRSSRTAADVAAGRALEAARAVQRLLPPGRARAYARWHAAALSPDPRLRARAQQWLGAAVRGALEGLSGEPRRRLEGALFDDLAQLVRAERYVLDRLRAQAMDARRQALLPLGLEPEAALRSRQRVFEQEETVSRAEAIIDGALAEADVLERAPHRPYSEGEEALFAEELRERERFSRLTRLQAEALEEELPKVAPGAWLAEERRRDRAQQEAAARAARPASGVHRFAAGPAVLDPGSGPRPAVFIRSAVVAEDLGEARLRGFGRGGELRLLDGVVELAAPPPGRALPEVIPSRVVLLAYRTLEREPVVARGDLLSMLGWGAGMSWESWYGGRFRLVISGEALAVGQSEEGGVRHAAFGLGASAEVGAAGRTPHARAGPELSFSLRAPLFSGAALRLEGRAALRWPGRVPEVRAAAELSVRAGPLLLAPGVELWALEGGGRAVARVAVERW